MTPVEVKCRCRHLPHEPYKCKGRGHGTTRRGNCLCAIDAATVTALAEHVAAGDWWDDSTGTWKPRGAM